MEKFYNGGVVSKLNWERKRQTNYGFSFSENQEKAFKDADSKFVKKHRKKMRRRKRRLEQMESNEYKRLSGAQRRKRKRKKQQREMEVQHYGATLADLEAKWQ